MTRARLYYEAHVTVEAGNDWAAFRGIWSDTWRVSRFDEDEVDDYHGKWFMSCRGVELSDVTHSVMFCVAELRRRGYQVVRWKIEDTVADSKHGDLLEELAT